MEADPDAPVATSAPDQHARYNEGTRGRPVPRWLDRRLSRYDGRRLSALLQAAGAPDPQGVQLFSNDYLSLANHRAIVDAQRAALGQAADSLWMSAVFSAQNAPQRRLERRFASYLDTDDCVLTQSGYCANVGLLQVIAGPDTRVYVDECAHASLWHGVLGSRAPFRRFAHNRPDALEALLHKSGGGLVLVDSVYSHDGSVCPLRDIAELAAAHECVLVVDESHSLGTHGPQGAGMVVELGLQRHVQFRTASLAKAFVARAGVIAASAEACWLIRHAAGPAIFSSSCMAHDFAGIERTLELIAKADDRRHRLREHAARVREELRALEFHIASESQIVSLVAGVETETLRLRQFLEARGIYGSVFCAPATRLRRSLVRLSLNAGLDDAQLDRLLQACHDARDYLDVSAWP